MDFFDALSVSATALSAQRTKLNVISENLANAETTRTEDGGPYRRKMVVFESTPIQSFDSILSSVEDTPEGVSITDIIESQDDFRLIYNPSHPDADPKTGYVKMPNVNMLTEMADMMIARRAYDANVTALSSTKSMLMKSLDIGK